MATRIGEAREMRIGVPLTTEEKASFAEEIAAIKLRLDILIEEKKAIAQAKKEEIEYCEQTLTQLCDTISSGTRGEKTKVLDVYNYETGKVTVVRYDTGEKLSRREMTEEEKQIPLL